MSNFDIKEQDTGRGRQAPYRLGRAGNARFEDDQGALQEGTPSCRHEGLRVSSCDHRDCQI